MTLGLFAVISFVVCLLAPAAHGEEPLRIVCLGDSVTKAVRAGVLPEETFSVVLEKKLNESGQPATVINAGIGGNTTADGLGRFERDVLAHKPKVVVLMFGLNDSWVDAGKTASRLTVAQYRANLEQMLSLLKEQGIQAVLMTPNPALRPTYGPERNATLKPYVEAVRSLAAERHLPLIDVYRHFAELALETPDVNTLFTDAMHPNPAGQRVIADLLYQHFAESPNK
jgi:lysophospholipase L1-like esterase